RDQGRGFDFGASAAAFSTQSNSSSQFGLFSIYERMSTLGGSLDVRSTPGQGTTATLTLPFQRAETTNGLHPDSTDVKPRTPQFALSSFIRSSSLSPPLSPHNILVLLVDDHAMVRQGLRSILEWYKNVEVVGEASDGEEAIASVAQYQPAVVVMDINMPK